MRNSSGTEAATGAPERGRRRERRRVPLSVLVVAVVVVGLLSPMVAQAAGPTFSDVSPSHPFYDDIEWMAEAGITNGYEDGTYRPNSKVTRAAMAAFMRRLNDRQNDVGWAMAEDYVGTSSTTYVDIPGAFTGVSVPEGATATITAQLTAVAQVGGIGNGHGAIRFMIARGHGSFSEMPPAGIPQNSFIGLRPEGAVAETRAIQRAIERPAGNYTVKAQYAVSKSQMNFAVNHVSLIVAADLHP